MAGSASIDNVQRVRILQLNIGSLAEPEWPSRAKEVSKWVDHLSPDVCCFQEVWHDGSHPPSSGAIETKTASYYRSTLALPGKSPTGQEVMLGSSILTRWPIVDQEVFELPGDQSIPFRPYVACWRTGELNISSAHLTPRPEYAKLRRAQVLELSRTCIEWSFHHPSALPQIICADLNAEHDSDEVRYLSGLTELYGESTSWQEGWRAAGRGWPSTLDPANPYAARHNLYPRCVDYIFVGEPASAAIGGAEETRMDRGRILDCFRFCDHAQSGAFASDHYGVCADVSAEGVLLHGTER